METNIQLWTYEAVLKAAEKGGRICEAVDGDNERSVFRIKYLEGFMALEQNRLTPDEDAEMDNLAEQLLDAKIGIAQDSAVDDLMEGVSRL